MAGIEFDTSELRKLATDLGQADARVAVAVKATTMKAALNIKNQLRTEAKGHKRFPTFALTINFDTKITPDAIETEIGPDAEVVVGNGKYKTPGNLAALVYFGGDRNGPTLPDPGGALDAEQPNYLRFLGEAVADGILP